jgi:hypothetical protein
MLAAVKDQENTYNAKISHLEYVRYLKWTLYVLIPKKADNNENEKSDTSLAASSGPSG